MNAFLCSSMNLELVCSILQGIQNTMETSLTADTQERLTDKDFKECTETTLKKLEILQKDMLSRASLGMIRKLQDKQNQIGVKTS